MKEKKTFSIGFFTAIAGFTLMLLSIFVATPAYAQSTAQDVDNGKCIKFHEDLYFLHDTGNWFCIRESPKACVSCHDGDPTATEQETAHYDRSAHPIVNEDISRCRECHTDADKCCECVKKFDQVAGLKTVKLATTVVVAHAPDLFAILPAAEEQEPVNWVLLFEILPLVVIAGLALSIYIVHKVRQA